MTVEHARAEALSGHGDGKVFCQVFFMDTRAYSKGYEEYYRRAKQKYSVEYTRCRISDLKEDPLTGNISVRYFSPYDGASEMKEDQFDLVVLSVGMEISESVRSLGHRLGISLDDYGFCHTTLFNPLQTTRDGIFVAGPFREPKDIPETVMEASGAAACAAGLLASARNTLAIKQEYPPEKDISAKDPRIGVFVCHCGINIGGYLDVPAVSEFAQSLPGVVHAENNLYTCSQDTIAHIIEQVKELDLNWVVVSSCTPITHEPLFQDAIRQAGLNPNLFEMANIRNQCSWVHSNDWESATVKAKKLTHMAVAKATRLEPLKVSEVPVNNTALVLGGGAAGMSAALILAEQGFPVHIVEKENRLGGNLKHLRYFVSHDDAPIEWSPQEYLAELIYKIKQQPNITVHLNTELKETTGFKGNFTSVLNNGRQLQVQHGAIIVATGGEEYKGSEYGYGQSERILTQLDFEQLLADDLQPDSIPQSVVMVLCVGPAERFCSRICCTIALKNALKLKEINPNADITILYRDIRTYGFKERIYTRAREAGVRFIHYDFDHKPQVDIIEPHHDQNMKNKDEIIIRVKEPILSREINLKPEYLVLSMPIVPPKSSKDLASILKLSTDMDGFFLEAHVKLRPVDFSADGIFMAGLAHYPKFLDETIVQAQAAASRASGIISQKTMLTNSRVAKVDPLKCVGCLTCVRICPYEVPKIADTYLGVGDIKGAAYIEPAVCHGCGSCASECPAQAIQLMQYTDAQILTKLDALFDEEPIIPVDRIPVIGD